MKKLQFSKTRFHNIIKVSKKWISAAKWHESKRRNQNAQNNNQKGRAAERSRHWAPRIRHSGLFISRIVARRASRRKRGLVGAGRLPLRVSGRNNTICWQHARTNIRQHPQSSDRVARERGSATRKRRGRNHEVFEACAERADAAQANETTWAICTSELGRFVKRAATVCTKAWPQYGHVLLRDSKRDSEPKDERFVDHQKVNVQVLFIFLSNYSTYLGIMHSRWVDWLKDLMTDTEANFDLKIVDQYLTFLVS